MSENVIEKLVEDIKHDAGEVRNNHPTHQGRHLGELLSGMADHIQAVTRPEQFMPPLSDWPEGAEWCSICAEGFTCFWRQTPKLSGSSWNFGIKVGLFGRVKQVEIPLGIDWRTLKVSRAQMEKWEAENG